MDRDVQVGAAEPAAPAHRERLERARQRSVMICTPIARNPVWEYTQSFGSTLLFLRDLGIRCTFHFVIGGSVVHKVRNELCAHFLKSDYTDMLMIDDDMSWSPNSVLRLLASDKPMIGGVGRMRVQKPNSDPNVWAWRPKHDGQGNLIQDEMGAIEVLGLGAAFLLVNRRVLADMVEAHPEWKKPGPEDWSPAVRAHYFEFFRQNLEGHAGEMSEDYVFCERWRQLGGTAWADPNIELGHVGSWNFQGSIREVLMQKEGKE